MMEKGKKGWHLNFGIKTDTLNAIKANIMDTPTLQRDFDRCLTIFKYYISSKRTAKAINSNISDTNTDRDPDSNKGRSDGGGGRVQFQEGSKMGAAVLAIKMA